MPKPKIAEPPPAWRSRIVGSGEEAPDQLLANPRNWRIHPKAHTARWHGPTNEVTVWEADRSAVNDMHPTQKPVVLAERAITNSSASSDIVIEPFSGSGTTLIACERLGRRCYAMEIEPKYVDVAVKRWEQFTGQEAQLARP